MNKSIKLLDQIIEKAKLDDIKHKKLMIKKHKAAQTVGESWMVFHLELLKGLILRESDEES